jgi:histidinol-phosphate/aromatic aminotransferase/cobyric acid decarboxylase-like protein
VVGQRPRLRCARRPARHRRPAGLARRGRRLREALVDGLVAAGLAPEPSDACWVLVEAPGLREVLAPRGVAVRDCTSFGLPDHVRIAVPDPAGLDRLLEALP